MIGGNLVLIKVFLLVVDSFWVLYRNNKLIWYQEWNRVWLVWPFDPTHATSTHVWRLRSRPGVSFSQTPAERTGLGGATSWPRNEEVRQAAFVGSSPWKFGDQTSRRRMNIGAKHSGSMTVWWLSTVSGSIMWLEWIIDIYWSYHFLGDKQNLLGPAYLSYFFGSFGAMLRNHRIPDCVLGGNKHGQRIGFRWLLNILNIVDNREHTGKLRYSANSPKNRLWTFDV